MSTTRRITLVNNTDSEITLQSGDQILLEVTQTADEIAIESVDVESGDFGLLSVDEDRAGESLYVRSVADETPSEFTATTEVAAYVDDDGIVRQHSNGAAFNENVYEVVR